MTNRILPFLLSLLLMFSCTRGDTPSERRAAVAQRATGDIVVAAVAPWNFPDATFWQGIEMAVDEIHGAGGILGRKIRIIREYDRGGEDRGIAVAEQYSQNQDLVAVIGHYALSHIMPVSVICQYQGILLLSTLPMDPGLTRQGFPLIFRMVPDETVYGKTLAEFCLKQNFRRILVFQQIVPKARDLANTFAISAQDMGLSIVERERFDSFTTHEEFCKILARSKRRFQFDAILVSGGGSQSAAFINAAEKLSMRVPVLADVVFAENDLSEMMGAKVEDVFLPTCFDPDAAEKNVRRFVKKFRKRFGKPPDALAAQAYDAVYTLAHAIKEAKTASPPKMAGALHKTKGFTGLTGPISFDAQGNRLGARMGMAVLKEGRFVYLP